MKPVIATIRFVQNERQVFSRTMMWLAVQYLLKANGSPASRMLHRDSEAAGAGWQFEATVAERRDGFFRIKDGGQFL